MNKHIVVTFLIKQKGKITTLKTKTLPNKNQGGF